MKNSKRILGAALALIMIFNVFAVGTFAAFPADTAVKLQITSDKAVYAPGDEIIFTISEQCIDEIGTMQIAGQYEIAYQDAVLDPYTTSVVLDDHGMTAIQAGYDAGISGVQIPAASTGATNANGWDSTICYVVCSDGTAFAATEMTDLFTIKMKIAEDAPNGTYTIGFNPQGYEDYNAYSVDGLGFGGLYGTSASDFGFSVANMYEYGTCEITVGEEAPVEYDLKWKQNQWRESVNVEGAYDVGVKFGFDVSDIDIQFEGTRSTNVARVGADIYVGEDKVDGVFESEFVYEVGTEYHYRVIIEGLAKDDATEYTVKPYLVYTDGTQETETVYGETVTVRAIDVIPQ